MTFGEHTHSGITVGILMLETTFPRIPGDIGNARTFTFPVVYKIVRGITPARLIFENDCSIIDPFIDAGKALLSKGVKAIVTSCGFLALYHDEINRALDVPVFTSSLIQIPLVYALTGRRVGVLTTSRAALTKLHFESVGAAGFPIAVEGVQDTYLWSVLCDDQEELDPVLAERDVVQAAKRLLTKNKDIGTIVLECTNFPPYAKAIQDEVGLAVFDIVTMTNMLHETVDRRRYCD